MNPGERIKELRTKNRKTQEEFGKIIRYSNVYVSEIERGLKDPSPEFLTAVEDKFGASPGYILWGLPDSLWNTIKDVLQSADPPEELLQKMRPLISAPSSNDRSVAFSDVHNQWQKRPPVREKRLAENKAIRAFVEKVVKILSSGNQKVIKALESNVEVFWDSINTMRSEIAEVD